MSATIEQLQAVKQNLRAIRQESLSRRLTLDLGPNNEWPLGDLDEVLTFVSELCDKARLSPNEKNEILNGVKNLIESLPGTPSVSKLEGRLIDFSLQLNLEILDKLIEEIADAGSQISIASDKLQDSINRINQIKEAFGFLSIAVNLAASIFSVSTGNFASLLKLIDILAQLA